MKSNNTIRPETTQRLRESKAGRGGDFLQGIAAGTRWVEADDGAEWGVLCKLRRYFTDSPTGRDLLSNAHEDLAIDSNRLNRALFNKAIWPGPSEEEFWARFAGRYGWIHGWMPDGPFIRGFIFGAIDAFEKYEAEIELEDEYSKLSTSA